MMKHFLEMTTEEREYALDCAQTFLKWTREDIKNVTKSFFKIGFRLYEARAYKYYEALGYSDIETLAEEEFGFKRSTTYGLIQVYEKTCTEYGHNLMDEKYIGYDYSKLLELSKTIYGGDGILSRIKPTDSVRDIKKYIKFWNDYSKKHSGNPSITLQEWKAQQAQMLVLPPPETACKQIEGQITIDDPTERAREQAHAAGLPFYEGEMTDDFNPYVYDGNMSVEDYKLMHKHMEEDKKTEEEPSAPVQTFGLPTCAKAETEPTTKPEKPKYNFSTRAGVREFLHDYENWEQFYGFVGCFFHTLHSYTFKNGVKLYAAKLSTVTGSGEELETISPIDARRVQYFIQKDLFGMAKEITQNQIEQYCAKHKDEL